MKLLLARDEVEPDSKNNRDRTPLSHAAGKGHEALVKLLLATDGVDRNPKDNKGWTPLSSAAWSGHEAVIALLLGTDGVDVDWKGHVIFSFAELHRIGCGSFNSN